MENIFFKKLITLDIAHGSEIMITKKKDAKTSV